MLTLPALRRLSVATAVLIAAAILLFRTVPPPSAYAAVGGPVIIGGDDLTDHGEVDLSGNPVEGWLYIEDALKNIAPNVTRANDGSVAAIGSTDGTSSCPAGEAIGVAAAKAGLTVTYHEGATAINQLFADIASGTATPQILWIAGDDARCDLSDPSDGSEAAALTAHAAGIAAFVNSGGGLLSHGTEYGWLFALLPSASAVDSGSSDDLYFTPEGTAALPDVTVDDLNAGPWHNHFEGNLGGLTVLVRSSSVQDRAGNDAAVIIGGTSVKLPPRPPSTQPHVSTATPTHTPPPLNTATAEATSTATPKLASTVLAAVATPRPPAPTGVVAPNTGSGPDASSRTMLGIDVIAAILLAFGATAAVAGIRRRR